MPFVSCSKFNQSQATQDQAIADLAQELLTKQNALNDCSGNPLAGTVPTCAQMNTAISSAIAGGTSPTGAAGGDLEGTYPNPTVKDQAIADAVTDSTAVKAAVAAVFKDCNGNPRNAGDHLVACSDLQDAIDGISTAPTGAAGGDLEGTYPNPTVKDQAIADAVTGSTAVQTAVAGVFNRCDGTDMPAGASLIECSAKGTDIPYLVSGVIPATQLPSYVDDVLEFPALANFPATGEAGKMYIDASTGKTYRWNGAGYTEISASAGITVQDEGSVLTTAATSLNFVGGVQATSSGGAVTVTVPSAPTDTYILAGSGLPTGTPVNNGGSSYAQNAEGELFLYNAATGTWVLIANGYHVGNAAAVDIKVPNFGSYRTALFTMHRAGWINLTSFSEALAEDPNVSPTGETSYGPGTGPGTGESRMATGLKVMQNGIRVCQSDTNISNYLAGDGVRNSLAGMIAVAAGDVIEVFFEQNNIVGGSANLRNYNTQIHYLT